VWEGRGSRTSRNAQNIFPGDNETRTYDRERLRRVGWTCVYDPKNAHRQSISPEAMAGDRARLDACLQSIRVGQCQYGDSTRG